MRLRELAWRAALAAAGLAPGPVAHVVARPAAAAVSLLREQPDAIVCASDALALAVVAAARELGAVRARTTCR